MKCSVFIAASVDGFIARPDGDIDWLHEKEYDAAVDGDFGFAEFCATIDVVILGRKSFEVMTSFTKWPYGEIPVTLLSDRGVEIPETLRDRITLDRGTPEDILARLKAQGRQHAYIDGGVTIQRFLKSGLIDEITLTRIPILLGTGIPLFGWLKQDIRLRVVKVSKYKNGFVQTIYRVA